MRRAAGGHRPRGWIPAVALLPWLLTLVPLRADLIWEQQTSDTNQMQTTELKLHGDKMRMDLPADGISVIVNLATRDSYTLLTNKTYLQKFGSEVRWEMKEERKVSGGTNELDARPARAVATGKSDLVNGYPAEIYTWSGAHGLKETLWVATNFPNYAAIRAELVKLDRFNDGGPHRNRQPFLSPLPGMVVRSETTIQGRTVTNTLRSVQVAPVDAALLEVPKDYTPWKRPDKTPAGAAK